MDDVWEVDDVWELARQILGKQQPGTLQQCRQARAAFAQLFLDQRFTIEVKQVERVEHDPVLRMRASVLQGLERGSALLVHGNDFAVDDCLPRTQPPSCGREGRIHEREIFVVPRANLYAVAAFQEERAIAIELDLVEPLIALRQFRDCDGGERFLEGRRGVPAVLLTEAAVFLLLLVGTATPKFSGAWRFAIA